MRETLDEEKVDFGVCALVVRQESQVNEDMSSYYWEFKKNGDICLQTSCGSKRFIFQESDLECFGGENGIFWILDNSVRLVNILRQFSNNRLQIFKYLMSKNWAAMELGEDAPAFLYLASCSELHITINESCLADDIISKLDICLMKRHDIAWYFGFPAEKWVVKLLQKIPGYECSAELFDNLRNLLVELANDSSNSLGDEAFVRKKKKKILQHTESITAFVIEVLMDDVLVRNFEQGFFDDISALRCSDRAKFYRDLVRRFKKYVTDRTVTTLFYIPQIQSTEHLDDFLSKVYDELIAIEMDIAFVPQCFDIPPVPAVRFSQTEDYGIFPIINEVDLITESEKMDHCVDTYSDQIQLSRGDYYIYHVRIPGNPEATLAVRRDMNYCFLDQIASKGNEPVTPNVLETVKRWLGRWNDKQENLYHIDGVGLLGAVVEGMEIDASGSTQESDWRPGYMLQFPRGKFYRTAIGRGRILR